MAAQRGISQAGTTSNEAEELKVQLRDALLDANESGKMAEVLDALLGCDDGCLVAGIYGTHFFLGVCLMLGNVKCGFCVL